MSKRGQVVAITGGGSGIGRALCLRFAAQGNTVVALDLNLEAAQKTATLATAGKIHARQLDVADRDAFASAVAAIESQFGPLDTLINNAGVGVGGEVRDHLYEDWQRIFAVNFFGTLHGIMAVYPRMLQRKSGTIVNVASVAGLFPLPGEAAYTASKYAVVGLTRVLAAEAKALGVRAVLVCPGKIETPIYSTSDIRGFDKQKALALWPKGIDAEDCAKRIQKGVEAGESVIVITKLAQALWRLERQSPELVDRLAQMYMKRLRRFRLA